MNTTLQQLAELAGGQLGGDGSIQITGAALLRDARPGEISLADSADLEAPLRRSSAAAVVVPQNFQPEGIPLIVVDHVHQSFARIVSFFRPPRQATRLGVSPEAHVSPSARLASDVDVHPGATIGEDVSIGSGSTIHSGVHIMAGCQLGEHVTIFSGAVLYENTVVGTRAIIHAGAVLGAYGFGYELADGRHQLSAQLGNVEIGSDVEIGACSTIDRGTYGPTTIGEGTKIDDQVMIAHNCRIGRHNLLCSQVGIAGSTTTGDYVVMAGQVGVRDHVHIGEKAVLGAKAGVLNNVPPESVYIGIPATPERNQKLQLATLTKLPEMRKQLKALQRTVEQLAGQIESTSAQDAA